MCDACVSVKGIYSSPCYMIVRDIIFLFRFSCTSCNGHVPMRYMILFRNLMLLLLLVILLPKARNLDLTLNAM
jgi:hypothetical protein